MNQPSHSPDPETLFSDYLETLECDELFGSYCRAIRLAFFAGYQAAKDRAQIPQNVIALAPKQQ